MLPEGIPTVTVTGRYLRPDGTPLTGQVVFRAPSLVTFADHDVILGGPVTVPLDTQGAFSVTLPATDAPGMNPSGWTYTVAEQFATVTQNRSYQILLPATVPEVDIADIAPADPTTPNYVPVPGPSAYEVAVDEGFTGTEAEWLASLEGAPGVVQSVNGQAVAAVVLDADDVGALPATGGTVTGPTTIQPSAGNPLTAFGSTDPATYFRITAEGHPYSNSLRPTFYNLGIGDTSAPFAGGTFVLGMKNRLTAPTDTPVGGLVAYADAGKLKILQGDGTTVTAGAVQSVNGAAGAVVLDAADVGAIPDDGQVSGGNLFLNTATVDYRGFSFQTGGLNRWVFQVDGLTEAGADAGSNFELANWSDAGVWKSAVLFGNRATGALGIGTNTLAAGAKATIAGPAALANTAAPTAAAGHAMVYAEGGLARAVHADGTRGLIGQTRTAVKPSDTSRASTIAPAADPVLALTVAANATYLVECVGVWTSGGGGFRADWTGPAGATMVWTDNDGSSSPDLGTDLTFAATTGTTFKGALVVGATAGTLTFRWAQNTSNAAATVLKAGCYLRLERVA